MVRWSKSFLVGSCERVKGGSVRRGMNVGVYLVFGSGWDWLVGKKFGWI